MYNILLPPRQDGKARRARYRAGGLRVVRVSILLTLHQRQKRCPMFDVGVERPCPLVVSADSPNPRSRSSRARAGVPYQCTWWVFR